MSRHRSALLPLVIAILGMLPTPAFAGAEFPIWTAEKDQLRPDISGSVVVWEDAYSSTDHDVRGYDLAQSLPIPIAIWTSNQQAPAISGDIVVWDDDRNSSTTGQDIYGYNIVSASEFSICTEASNQYSPAVDGDIVAWEETRNYDTTDWDIYGRNLSTWLEFPVCTDADTQTHPAVAGDIVAWEDKRNFASDVYGYRLSSGLEFPICTDGDWQYDPAVSGNTVVWWDTRGGTTTYSDIYGYDVSTETEFPIATGADSEKWPDISGNIVVWQDSRNEDTSGHDIYGYDLSTGVEFPICTQGDDQYEPAISGNIVVWADDRNSATTKRDIYGRGLPVASFTWSPAEPSDFDVVYFTDQSTDYGGTIVSWSWDFGDGATSDQQHPWHDFEAGTWTVCLTVTDSGTPPISMTHCETITVTGHGCLVSCGGSACGGPGPRRYFYEMVAPSGTMFDRFAVGTHDPNLDHYGNWMLPLDWSVAGIFPEMGPGHGDFHPHGGLSMPTGVCPYAIVFVGPPRETAWAGFDHPGEPHDVGWMLERTIEPTWGCLEDWASPVGLGQGPVHGPLALNEPPVCCFEYAPPEPDDQTPVEFFDCSHDPDGSVVSWLWEFGDGGVSLDQNSAHLFQPGEWTVCLTVTDNGDPPESAACCQVVTVAGHPCQVVCHGAVCGGAGERSYWYELAAPSGSTLQFFAMGTHDPNLDHYSEWILPPDWGVVGVFPDAVFADNGMTPHGLISTPGGQCPCLVAFAGPPIEAGVIAFNHPGGPHDVGWQLTESLDLGWVCNADWASPVGLGQGPVHGPLLPPNEPPVCCFEYVPPEPDDQTSVEFFDCSHDPDGSVVSWEWDFGDGGTSTAQNPTHLFAAGSYRVALTVTDDRGASTACGQDIVVGATTVTVSIPLSAGWHMISLPLEPVNKTILVDRASGVEDAGSIFYTALLQGNDPRMRLFRMEPAVGYWVYNPALYPDESWYEIGVEPPAGKPSPGPWWQGFWLLVEVPEGITLSYEAYPMPEGSMPRFLDLNENYPAGTYTWAWMLMGACARVPEPYDPNVTTWPLTNVATDTMWGEGPPEPPLDWLPTCVCEGPDAWDEGCIGVPLVGFTPGVGYYSVSPLRGEPYCGPAADTNCMAPGEGYWLDVEHPQAWLRLLADQWP